MSRKIIRVSFGAIVLVCIACFFIGMAPSNGKFRSFNNHSLRGNYASQLTGSINYPEASPFSQFNGSYALTGRVTADGKGNAWGTVYENWNGMLLNYSWQGTYNVESDGTVLLLGDYVLEGMGEFHVQMFGVLCDRGKRVRLMHVGPIPVGAPAPNMLGTTVTGSWTRQ